MNGIRGRGYGKAAMTLILDYIRSEPCGPADICWLSYEPENQRAKALYASFLASGKPVSLTGMKPSRF